MSNHAKPPVPPCAHHGCEEPGLFLDPIPSPGFYYLCNYHFKRSGDFGAKVVCAKMIHLGIPQYTRSGMDIVDAMGKGIMSRAEVTRELFECGVHQDVIAEWLGIA